MGDILKEILLSGFDEENPPLLRVFSNGTTFLLFEEFPPENEKLTDEQIDNFEAILSEKIGAKVIREDRELFIIYSNKDEVIEKIVSFFNSFS
jgi:hypothetical protein